MIFLLFCLLEAISPESHAKDKSSLLSLKGAPKVYLDCSDCDQNFVKSEIRFVNYMRDKKDAQIHILVTREKTGGGGTKYFLDFLGQGDFESMKDRVEFDTKPGVSDEEIRNALVQHLKLGLIRYVAKTPLKDRISIGFEPPKDIGQEKDPWNSWVLALRLNGMFHGQSLSQSQNVFGGLSANRITPELKTSFGVNANYGRNVIKASSEEIVVASNGWSFDGAIVKSLSNHWSVGGWGNAYHSTYSNAKVGFGLKPAVEYNIFPYRESNRKQLRFLYLIGVTPIAYINETLLGKTWDALFSETLSIALGLKQKWGTVETSLSGTNYFHDFAKGRLTLDAELALNIANGLALTVNGSASLIKDQFHLPKKDFSTEDILLRNQELPTDFSYFLSLGFKYTFGSIYNNVVNPRFGT